MPPTSVAPPVAAVSASGTEERLLRAAERLFAERGIGSVSLRAVMQAARTNVAAVHYHFGSKEALVDAVVRSRIDQVSSVRESLVAADDPQPDAHRLARAFVAPLTAIARDGGRDWLRVIGQLLATNDPALAPISSTFFARNPGFLAQVHRLDPTANDATTGFRLVQAMTLALRVLGDPEHVHGLLAGDGPTWSPEEVESQLLDVVAAVLAGPPRP